MFTHNTKQHAVLIVGGAGFLGSHLASELLETGLKVTCMDLISPSATWRLDNIKKNDKFSYIWQSLHDLSAKDLVGYETVVVLSAQADVPLALSSPRYTYNTNVMSVVNLLEVARKSNAEDTKLIYMSSENVYGRVPPERVPIKEEELLRPANPYGASKAAADMMFQAYNRAYGLPTVVLRSATMYGPRSRTDQVIPIFIRKALMNEPIFIEGDGSQTRDFNYVRNVVEAIELVLSANKSTVSGEVFNVGFGQEVSILNIANEIIQTTKSASKVVFRPWRAGEQGLRLALDISKIKQKLKYQPLIDMEQGLRMTGTWVLETVKSLIEPQQYAQKATDIIAVESK